MWDSSTREKLVLSINGLDLWWVEFGFLDAMYIMGRIPSPLSWRPLISSKDQEENLVTREKSPLLQLWHPWDRATFSISFVMESGMPKPSFRLILIKRFLVYAWILYGIIIRSNSINERIIFWLLYASTSW